MINSPFNPTGTPLNISASTTSANGAMSQGGHVRIANKTSSWASIRWSGTAGPTALTTDLAVAPGEVEILDFGTSKYVAVILDSGTGTVQFTPGRGI